MLDANKIRYGRKKKENPSFWKFDIYQLNWRARFPGRVSLPSQKLSSLIIRLFNSSCQRYCSISRCHTLTPFSFSFFFLYLLGIQSGWAFKVKCCTPLQIRATPAAVSRQARNPNICSKCRSHHGFNQMFFQMPIRRYAPN